MTPTEPRPWQHRRAWSRARIRAGRARGPIPQFGSPEWCALAGDDPRRLAAAIIASECWVREGNEIPLRLDLELRALREHDRRSEAAAVADLARGIPGQLLAAERRRLAADTGPRPGDHPGGPVDWNTGQPLRAAS